MSEQTYRNPLFGQRVDRYIPPELRQGLGAVLALGDMLNPVSAYREYVRDVGEGDVVGGATNLAGFVAPGAAGAIASRLGRSGIRAIEPYSDDAARALMEMLSPTGAPEVSRGAEGMSRREFLAGLGAAAATPALPVDEMLGGLGRVGARGGVGLSGRLGALAGLRGKINELDEFLEEPRQLQNALNRALQDASWSPDILMTRETAEAKERFVRETEGELDNFNQSYGPMFSERAVTQDMIIDGRRDLVSDIARNADAFADELGDLSDDELRGLADQIEDFMNNPTADLPVYDLVKGSEGEDIVGLFERNMGGFADRLEAEAARRGLEDVRLGVLREYLGEPVSEVRSSGVDEFGFVPDDFNISPRMVGGVEDFGRGLGSVRLPSAEASQRTQIAGTFPTYEKAVKVFDEVAPDGRSLDYGAGLGKSSELGFDTFEPFAREGFDPTYRVSSDIPDASYERVTNLNVLNVLDPETRRGVVLDIGRVLKPEGVAVITTRGRDVLTSKGERGPEDMSVITTAGTYQKGFTKPELVSYLRDTLGEGFEVKSLNLGPAGALVRKLPVSRPD